MSLESFLLKGHTLGLQHNEQHLKKVLLSCFYLNGHRLGFDSQTQNLEPPCTVINIITENYCSVAFT